MLKRIVCQGELHLIGGDGTVYHADFRQIKDELLSRYGGLARVVYIDPPFNTGGSFEYRRGKKQLAYSDRYTLDEYRSLIYDAVSLSHSLLSIDGTFFIHIDYHMSAHVRLICDEVFGESAFTNEIIWTYKSGGRSVNSFSKKHDTILMYRKSENSYFNIAAVGTERGSERRNHMKRGVDTDGRVYYSIKTSGKEYRYYEDDMVYPSDVWDDIEHLHQRHPERTGFLTQKPKALLKRIILSCSKPGDTVIDLFGGSGTTAVTAAELGRSFAAVDKGSTAIGVTRNRLIERGMNLSLLDHTAPMSVELNGDGADIPLEKYFDISENGSVLTLVCKKLSADKCPTYAAIGTVNGNVFTAANYIFGFTAGQKISMRCGECLHIVDADFEYAFFKYESEPMEK